MGSGGISPVSTGAMSEEERKLYKKQEESLFKAATKEEDPIKFKHVRNAVVMTWEVRRGDLFWAAMLKMPLGTHAPMCFKSLIIVHKLLHDGHPSVLPETYQQKGKLRQLGGVWAHNSSPYAPIITSYVQFLTHKLDFHHKYQQLPGDLNSQLDAFGVTLFNDTAGAYAFLADVFDLHDYVMELGSTVLGSLNLKLSTKQTECRVIALVPIAWESRALYFIAMQLLQLLHRELDLETLAGHDKRFVQQWYKLKKFYYDINNLQYIRGQVQVPELGEAPPGWLQVAQPPPPPMPREDKFAGFGDVVGTVSFGNNADLEAEIARLRKEIERLLQEIAMLKAEILRLNGIIASMTEDRDTMNVSAARARERFGEMEALLAQQREMIEQLQAANEELATKGGGEFEAKFKKMQEMYTKLRADHLGLLKQSAATKNALVDAKKISEKMKDDYNKWKAEVETLRAENTRFSKTIEELKNQGSTEANTLTMKHHAEISELEKGWHDKFEAARLAAEEEARKIQAELDRMAADAERAKEEAERIRKAQAEQQANIINGTVEASKTIITRALEDFESPGHMGNESATAEYTIASAHNANQAGQKLSELMQTFFANPDRGLGGEQVAHAPLFASAVAELLNNAKGSLRLAADDSVTDGLIDANRKAAKAALNVLQAIAIKEDEDLPAKVPKLKACSQLLVTSLAKVETLTDKLIVREVEDSDQLGGLLVDQMGLAAQQISEAAKRLEELLAKAKLEQSGLQLNVNESILAGSKALMECIRILVERATVVQNDIVEAGRGSANVAEFYRQNHTWAEGLISAAKEVGWGANVLVESADGVVGGTGKYEALIAAANEIMSSTAHLVAASRVKAERGSKAQERLEAASTDVREATRELVKAAKNAGEVLASQNKEDLSKLSDNQAKRAEMQKQIRALELEKELEMVRKDLFELRKANYERDRARGLNDGAAPPTH